MSDAWADDFFNDLNACKHRKTCWSAAEELTAARDEAERLQLWAAGLESVLQEIAGRDRVRQYESCPDCFHKCSRETGCHSMRFSSTGDLANGALLGARSGAWLLRKQAEAVDEVNRRLTILSEETSDRMSSKIVSQYCARIAGEESQRLRNQADELEKSGGTHD